MITANKAYEIAYEILDQRKKEDKELMEIERLIVERAKSGQFYLLIKKQLSNSTLKTLRNFNYNVHINCLLDNNGFISSYETHISWYAD